VNEQKIQRALPALDRADADMVAVAAQAEVNRREVADWKALLDGLVHVSPALYAPFS
jgi:hypothetical protein